MAAGSFVAVTQLATRSDLNLWHKVAIGLFALSLPVFVALLIVWKAEKILTDLQNNRVDNVLPLAALIFCGGTLSLFASFGVIYCVALVIGFCLALWISPSSDPSTRKIVTDSDAAPPPSVAKPPSGSQSDATSH